MSKHCKFKKIGLYLWEALVASKAGFIMLYSDEILEILWNSNGIAHFVLAVLLALLFEFRHCLHWGMQDSILTGSYWVLNDEIR